MWSICNDGDAKIVEDDINKSIAGTNSAITPLKKKKQPNSETNKKQKSKYALTDTANKHLRERSIRELDECLCFWSQNRGCLHVRAELYMATGVLDRYTADLEPCGDACCVCNGDWSNFFLPVDRDMVFFFCRVTT